MTIKKEPFGQQFRTIDRNIFLFLIVVVVVQTLYPVTASGSTAVNMIYALFSMSIIVGGILLARGSRLLQRLLIALAVAWFVIGTASVVFDSLTLSLLGFPILILFNGVMIVILLRFIFFAPHVDRGVIYAACAIYFLLSVLFTAVFGFVETLTFMSTGGEHAFSDGVTAVGEIFPWQTLRYYSYATLTTLGYGDVLPVTMWARTFASLEASVGVLYITIIMARLVGLYASHEVVEEEKELLGGQ